MSGYMLSHNLTFMVDNGITLGKVIKSIIWTGGMVFPAIILWDTQKTEHITVVNMFLKDDGEYIRVTTSNNKIVDIKIVDIKFEHSTESIQTIDEKKSRVMLGYFTDGKRSYLLNSVTKSELYQDIITAILDGTPIKVDKATPEDILSHEEVEEEEEVHYVTKQELKSGYRGRHPPEKRKIKS